MLGHSAVKLNGVDGVMVPDEHEVTPVLELFEETVDTAMDSETPCNAAQQYVAAELAAAGGLEALQIFVLDDLIKRKFIFTKSLDPVLMVKNRSIRLR